jgi:HAMP domain-containing protein
MMPGGFERQPLQTQFRVPMGVVLALGCIMALVLWRSRLDGMAWITIGAFFASLAYLLWFVQAHLIRPVRQISVYAQKVSESDIADLNSAELHFSLADQKSGNELQRMTVALKRLLRSLKVQRNGR